MALPERIAQVKKEMAKAFEDLEKSAQEFEAIKKLMDATHTALRTGKVPESE